MRRSIPQLIAGILVVGSFCVLSAQQAVVRKNAILREEPGAASAVEAHLQVGNKLTILDPTPEHGYYQVKTQDGKDGWVFSRTIKIFASPSSSDPAIDPEAIGIAQGSCDNTLWQHVYHPTRLIVKQQCLAVTGTIVDATNGTEQDGVRHEADGDTHGWLKLDSRSAHAGTCRFFGYRLPKQIFTDRGYQKRWPNYPFEEMGLDLSSSLPPR